jgi:chromosome segregation and condensation protein ScpB
MNLKGVLEGILFVQGDEGATVKQLMDILEIDKGSYDPVYLQ